MKKKYLAECIGTFALALVVTLGLTGQFVVPVPLLAVLTLMLFVYSIGHISGTHLNPAVTLGLLSIKKISFRDAVLYIVAQLLGAVLAMVTANALGVQLLPGSGNAVSIGVAESIGMFFFTFGIASVVAGSVHKAASGLVVGGSLLLGIAFAVLAGSAGVLNPAVAFSIQLFTPMYILGPIVGSILGFNAYAFLDSKSGK